MSTSSFLDDDDDSLSSVPPSPPQSPMMTTPTVHISPTPLPVQSLVAGRARRSNAGNLLAKLLTQEADADDTLFLEDEDDVEFFVKREDRADDDDVLMESSSDEDEDAAEGGDGDEQEGEREILLAEKDARKARKRKADDAFLKPRKQPAPRKERRVTIREGVVGRARQLQQDEDQDDGTGEETDGLGDPTSRPRKKAEFVATRASSRTLSLQNRSETMRRLEESEKRRLHTIALMERAAAKKEKVRPKKEMTQEERLEEAKITERRNRRSLFSWEETEKAKLEEQRERLAALQNRKWVGPVITYWSGVAEWNAQTGRLVKVGKGLVQEVVEVEAPVKKKRITKKEKEREREKEMQKEMKKGKKDMEKVKDGKEKEQGADEKVATQIDGTAPSENVVTAEQSSSSPSAPKPLPITTPAPATGTVTAPGIATAPSTATATRIATATSAPPVSPQKGVDAFPATADSVAEAAVEEDPAPPEPLSSALPREPAPSALSQETAPSMTDEKMPLAPPQETPRTPPPLPNEVSARNLIVLENFEPSTVRDKASLVKVLWGEQSRRFRVFLLFLLPSVHRCYLHVQRTSSLFDPQCMHPSQFSPLPRTHLSAPSPTVPPFPAPSSVVSSPSLALLHHRPLPTAHCRW